MISLFARRNRGTNLKDFHAGTWKFDYAETDGYRERIISFECLEIDDQGD